MNLHAPGMTLMHRAGLGGLAATLRAMERRHRRGQLRDQDLPQGPALDSGYSWLIEPTRITLDWGEPTAAGDYLRKLFAFAFGIEDRLIDLPGTCREELSRAVRAELHNALILTFLQHGRTRKVDKKPVRELYDPEGDGTKQIAIEYRPIHDYKHRDGAADLSDRADQLTHKRLEIIGPLNPGAVVRHVAFAGASKMEAPVEQILPLYFSLVGCLSLSINRGSGALLAPEVMDLAAFADTRPLMTPRSPRECRIAGASDAALQMALRLRSAREARSNFRSGVSGIYAMQLAPTPWATQQKSRIYTVHVPAMDRTHYAVLRRFDIALRHLPPRVRARKITKTTGRGRNKQTVEHSEWFWIDSVVRPVIADNLAHGRRWYDGFTTLMRDREIHTRIHYEYKGLQSMAEEQELTENDEMRLIQALHRAIFLARGKIYAETMGRAAASTNAPANQATKNRWNRFMERLRLKLIGAKTQSQTQDAISEILARTGIVSELQDAEALRQVKDLVFGDDWRRARDLALFALASYKRPPKTDPIPGDAESENHEMNSEPTATE